MSVLPRPVYPSYEIVIPSLKKKVKFRPYKSVEEKVLAIAMESENISEITNAIKLILENCIQTKDIDVEKLATFDIEYLFLNVRAKASGETIDLQVLYPGEEELYVPVQVNIDEIKMQETKGHTNVIKLDDDLTMIMKYPTFDFFIKEQFEMPEEADVEDKMKKGYDLIASCVDKICKGDEVWLAEDVGREEVISFLDDLLTKQFEKVEEFLNTMPQLKHTIKVQHPTRTVIDPKTKKEVPEEAEITLNGLIDFFI